MKVLRKKIVLIIMGMALCFTHSFFGKSKKKKGTEEALITQEKIIVNQSEAEVEKVTPKDPLVFKSPLIKEYLTLAESYYQEKMYEKATDFYTKTVAMDPCNFNALKGLATISYIQKEFNRAIEYYETIITHYPRCVSAYYNAGLCYVHNKQYTKAINALKKTITLDAKHYKAWHVLGSALEADNNLSEAFDAYQQSLTINPDFAPAHYKTGMMHKTMRNYQKAITHLEHAQLLDNDDQQTVMELAHIFNTLNHHEKALSLYVTILKKDPLNIQALYNCGFTLKKQNHLDQALEVYDKVLALDPHHAKSHFSKAEILLSRAQFSQGFREYEWRFKAHNQSESPYNIPVWTGSPLNNKTILVRAEQSIDDTLQFARYIPLLQQQGATVVFQVQNEIKQLLQISDTLGTVIGYNDNPAACDFQISLMSIPFVLKTTIETVPPIGDYLHADEHLIAYWKSHLAHDLNFKIGIYWHEETQKNIPLSVIQGIAAIGHVTLYSLHRADQKNQGASQEYLREFGVHFDTIHGPFMDSAAIIKNLDLIITIDSTIAHLAATLKAPTWIILADNADWRWLVDRSDSPWYPTARLFRLINDDYQSITSSLVHSIQMLAEQKQQAFKSARCDLLENPSDANTVYSSMLFDERDALFLQDLQRAIGPIIDKGKR